MKRVILFLILIANAFGYYGPVTSFNSGQVSPLLEARADFAKYNSSCRTIENMLVTVQGPALKRPGTKFIAEAKTGTVRLLPFEFSTDDAYIIEAGALYMRFYRNGGQILDPVNPVEIVTPYSAGELFTIQHVQTDNDLYLVNGTDPPQILIRADHDDWTIADVTFETGPFLPENDTTTTITPSGITGVIRLTASASIFESTTGASHVGSLWAIEQVRGTSTIEGTFDENENSISTPFFTGSYGFTTSNNSDGTITLQRSTNGGTSWRPALTALTDTDFDNPSEFEEDGAIYRAVMSGFGSPAINPTFTFTITDNVNKGVVRITSVASGVEAFAEVVTALVDTSATTTWREGYWSDFRGWPKTVAFHQQRLVYGGTTSFPQTIWFGKQDPDDYENFLEGTLDTSAFIFALEGQNPIRWFLSQDVLLIGTSGSCGKWGEQAKPATPTSPNYQEQTRHGAATIGAVLGGDSILYIERGSRNVREFGFQLQFDKYLSPDLSILSPEITDSGIKDVAFQLRPDPILWCVLNDGEIATLTYRRDQSVTAWTKQITDGDFESVAVISSGEDEDEVWVSVERVIDGTTSRCIEQFQPQDWGDQEDAWFVDSGATSDLGAAVTVTGATQADPGVITAVAHGFSNGEQVVFQDIGGMIELNGNVYSVAASAADTFALKDVTNTTDYDTTNFTAYTSGGTVQQVDNTYTGLEHLEGETVAVFADGIVQESEVVSGGSVTIDIFSNVTTVGLPYTAKLETLPIRVDPQDMTVNKKVQRLWIDFFQTGDASFGNGANSDLSEVSFFEQASVTAFQEFFTSTVKLKQFAFPYSGSIKQSVYLESSKPVPLGVRAIVPDIEIRR